MNVEFHYYILKYIALNSGFSPEDSEIIAYSSQFVDDNNKKYKIKIQNGTYFSNYISQTINILKPEKKLERIYLLFHFFPENPSEKSAQRKDGKMHILMTTPASENAAKMMNLALETKNLYFIGIASHMFADTFSHQNFIGTFEEINGFKKFKDLFVPNIGHADALFKPDIINLEWKDERLISKNQKINNLERFLKAAELLHKFYINFNNSENKWHEISKKIVEITKTSNNENSNYKKLSDKRIDLYKKLLKQEYSYDEYKWFNLSVNTDQHFLNDQKFALDPFKDKYSFSKNYENSHWYKFQKTCKDYQKTATNLLQSTLEQLDIHNW